MYYKGQWSKAVKEVKHNVYGETAYWESREDSFIYNKPLTPTECYKTPSKSTLIPIKVRRNKVEEVVKLPKRTKLIIRKQSRISTI